ncbi:hypothetical protein KIPB_009114, partial [Kipferlia bialata]|eukprot:g9114.t1
MPRTDQDFVTRFVVSSCLVGRHALCITSSTGGGKNTRVFLLDFVSLDLVQCQPVALEACVFRYVPSMVMLNPTTLLAFGYIDTLVVDVDERVLGPEYITSM